MISGKQEYSASERQDFLNIQQLHRRLYLYYLAVVLLMYDQ